MRILYLGFRLISTENFAGDTMKLYNLAANVAQDVVLALQKAKAENKHVLLKIGGYWCVWSYRFDAFVNGDSRLRTALQEDYIAYHLKNCLENKNFAYLQKLGYRHRFDFPVPVVLDAGGSDCKPGIPVWCWKERATTKIK